MSSAVFEMSAYSARENGDSSLLGHRSFTATSERRTATRHESPAPRSHLTSPMPTRGNGRSYSQTMRGLDDVSLLYSPMPLYPRRRSVTFVGEERAAKEEREERPNYHTTTIDSVVKSSKAESLAVGGNDSEVAAPPSILVHNPQFDHRATPKKAPNRIGTPLRRSASRQKMRARREEAEMNFSFYDDSFIEDFVSTVRTQKEQEEEIRANNQKVDEKERQQVADEERRDHSALDSRASATAPSDQQHKGDSRACLARLLKEFAAIESTPKHKGNASRTATPQKQQPLVGALSDSTNAQPMAAGPLKRDRSVMLTEDEVESAIFAAVESNREATRHNSTRRAQSMHDKLHRIVAEAMAARRKTSKRSVMLIDLDDIVSDASDVSEKENVPTVAKRKPPPASKGTRSTVAKPPLSSRPANSLVRLDADSDNNGGDESPAQKKARREPLRDTRQNQNDKRAEASVARIISVPIRKAQQQGRDTRDDSRPNFDDGDLSNNGVDSESERPVLLNRGQKRPMARRSISRLESEVDALISMGSKGTAQPPVMLPRSAPPPPQPRKGRGKQAKSDQVRRAAGTPMYFDASAPQVESILVEERQRQFTAPYAAPPQNFAPQQHFAPQAPAVTTATAGRKAPASRKPNSDDPFDQFYNLQFDSPAKFDEFVAAPSAPRSRGNGGLLLTTSFRKKR